MNHHATVIKIAIALIIVHGAWRVGAAFWTFYRFEDGLQQLAQFSERRTDKDLCDSAMETAGSLGVPIAAQGITIHRGTEPPYNCDSGPGTVEPGQIARPQNQLTIDAPYTAGVQVLPGYSYPWEFKPNVKAWITP